MFRRFELYKIKTVDNHKPSRKERRMMRKAHKSISQNMGCVMKNLQGQMTNLFMYGECSIQV